VIPPAGLQKSPRDGLIVEYEPWRDFNVTLLGQRENLLGSS